MATGYARALMDATLDELAYEARRAVDCLQVTLNIGAPGPHREAIRDLCTINAELLRRLRLEESDVETKPCAKPIRRLDG